MKFYQDLVNRINSSNINSQGVSCFYRGQANYEWELSTTLQRKRLEDRTFKDPYVNRSEFNPEYTLFENLARMQHYGTPTRALDFTSSIDVALYFACEKKDELSNDGALFVVSYCRPRAMLSTDAELLMEVASVSQEIGLLEFARNLDVKKPELILNSALTDIKDLACCIGAWCTFGLMIVPKDGDLERLEKFNMRMYRQKGALFVQGNKIRGTGANCTMTVGQCTILPELSPIPSMFSENRGINGKIRIPSEIKKELLDYLRDVKGISDEYIYPDK